MTRRYWFRRRQPPRQSRLKPICWHGYVMLIGGILISVAGAVAAPAFLGPAGLALMPIWLLLCLAILFALIARRTEP